VIETSDKAGSRIKAMDPVEAMPAEMKDDTATGTKDSRCYASATCRREIEPYRASYFP